MNFTSILSIVVATTLIVSPITFFISGIIFVTGTSNREEEAYRKGFEDGRLSKDI